MRSPDTDALRELADQARLADVALSNSVAEAYLDGTPQVAIAQAIGVTQPAVSQMLRRRRSRTIGRLWTIPVLAARLRADPDASIPDVLRACAQFVADFRRLSGPVEQAIALGPPEPTGSQRLDCLVAAVAAHEARAAGLEPPRWTVSARYNMFPSWYVTSTPRLIPWLARVTPPEFSVRGVFLDPHELESV